MLVNSILSFVVLSILLFLIFQILKQVQVIHLKKNAADQPTLLKKITIYETRFLKKQIIYLLVIILLLTIALVYAIYMLFELQNAKINDHRTILDLVENVRELQQHIQP